jgi:putative FmdB family regulatory protein
MPTYRYECEACGKIHEIFHSITAESHSQCPSCGGDLTRLIGGGGGVLLRGTGFYTTDNRSGDYRKAAKTEGEASSAPEAKSGAKSEEKKEAAKEPKQAAPTPKGEAERKNRAKTG